MAEKRFKDLKSDPGVTHVPHCAYAFFGQDGHIAAGHHIEPVVRSHACEEGRFEIDSFTGIVRAVISDLFHGRLSIQKLPFFFNLHYNYNIVSGKPRPSLLIISVLFIILLIICSHAKADPPLSGKQGQSNQSVSKGETGEDSVSAVSTVTMKKQYGYLEYDGTGYRLTNRTIKPEKAGHVRLKPVAASKNNQGKSDTYTIVVEDEKDREVSGADKQAAQEPDGEKPRITFEKADDLDRKGVSMQPSKGHKADVGLGLKVSESSELLMGRALILERREDAKNMDARDDGWRFRFKTNF